MVDCGSFQQRRGCVRTQHFPLVVVHFTQPRQRCAETAAAAALGLASFAPLFLQTPCPPSPASLQRAAECLSHLAITVCIYRRQSQDPLCARVCVCVLVRGRMGCFGVTLPKTKDP